MKIEKITKIREYLLGKNLLDEEKTAIEQELMTSDDYFQKLLIAEEELIEEYLDEQLTANERKDFEEKFLISAERREKVNFERLLRSYISEKNRLKITRNETGKVSRKTTNSIWQKWFSSPIPIVAAVLIIFGIVALVIFYLSEDRITASLNKAYLLKRPFESRITSLNYAPADNLRGKTDEKVNTVSRDLAAKLSLESVEKSETSKNLHNLGRVYLAEREFDKAIFQLNRAKNLDSQNARVLSDLGTALFEKSKNIPQNLDGKSFLLVGEALEEFEKALEINPNLPEAQFNKAICLQSRQMRREAQEAWRNYLKLDSDSKWADEARRNLQLLDTQKSEAEKSGDSTENFLAAYRTRDKEKGRRILNQNREMISGRLLPQQLAVLFLAKEGVERAEYLSALQYAGDIEKEKSGDHFFFEIAKFYSSLSPQNITSLQEAQTAVKNGYQLSKDNDYQKSLDEFQRAREIFIKTGNVWEEKISDYWINYNSFQLSKNEESNKKFEELAKFCEEKKYRWLASATFSRLGINALASNKYSKSLEYNKKALALAKEGADLYQEQKSYGQIAEVYQLLRQYPEAFKNIENAFRLMDTPETSVRQKLRTYMYATQIFYEKKLYAAAIHLLKETLSLNEEIQDKTYANYIYLLLSKVYDKAGERGNAFDSAQKSLEAAEALIDAGSRAKTVAISLVQIANLKRETGNFDEAIKDYDRSIEIYETIDFPVDYYEAKKNRLYCYFEKKDDETITNEIDSVLTLFEANRKKILEEQNRNSFFDSEQNIYDLAIEYEFSKGNYEKAFDYAETSRSRSLLDIQENGAKLILDSTQPQIIFDDKATATPLTLDEIRRQLPPQVQLVEYSVLRNEVLMWLITKDSVKTFSHKILNTEIEGKINNFLQLIEQKNGTEKAQARELYEILFRPFEDNLDKDKNIFLLPDKVLFKLPFSALFSAKTENFLVADYKLLLSPSANVFLNSSENARQRNLGKAENLLSIGNPAFDQAAFPNLPNLVSAEKEAEEIAKFYPNSEVLIGEQATKEAFKRKIGESKIIHFAGHYVTNEVSPLLSGFLVAGSGEKSNLANYELLEQRLDKTKLIVLAACETGTEGYFNGEGMIGAGRIFLASGVPLVVASQWKIDSDATIEMMEKFHRFRKTQEMDTASALRKAQTEMLNGEREDFRQPFYWAAFSAIGGYTEF